MTGESRAAHFVPARPFDLVIFGAAGDLSLRKLIPSLFHRWRDQQIPDASRMIGVSRTEMTDEAFRDLALESFRRFHPGEAVADDEWAAFAERLFYLELDAADPSADWDALSRMFVDCGEKERIFYLALPPGLYGAVSGNIAAAGVKCPGSRIVLEKPIGKDLRSAQEINAAVGQAITTARARFATWSRTIFSSFSASSRWSRPPISSPTPSATRRSRF